VLDDLTDPESALVDAARAGDKLASDKPIRAALIRELLLGRRGELDPRGLRLYGARVVGPLELEYVRATVGLDLIDCDVGESMNLSHAELPRLALDGSRLAAIRADGLHVGTFTMEGAEVRVDAGPALHADRLRVDGVLYLREARLFGHSDRSAVRLIGARVGGELNMRCAELGNDIGPALDAADLVVDGNLYLEEATVSGHGEYGAIRLRGAHVGGLFSMKHSEISNTAGPALRANSITVGGELVLDGLRASGAGADGALHLASARVGDDFYVTDAELRNDSGPALSADGIHVENTIVLLRDRISGAGEGGAVWLLGAHLGGLRITETELRNDSGPALFADQLQVRGHVFIEQARMSGSGDLPAVRLAVARIGGQFSLKGVTIENPSGPILDLREATVSGSARCLDDAVCRGQGCADREVDVNNFSYGSLTGTGWKEWLHVIGSHTKGYRPSPYQQLAAAERAAGHDGNARNILIAQQRDLYRRAPRWLGGWLTRRFHWLFGALAGYGYRTRRTAFALLLALMVAGLVSLWAGHVTTGPGRYAAEHTITSAAPGTRCSTVELVGLGLDRGLPLGPTGLRSRCDLDTESTAGQVFTVLLWVVQAAVWGLATLALAGYTGLVRKIT
jgi:hypothetical protein